MMDPLLLTELSTVATIAAIPLLYFVVETWNKGKLAGIRALFGALLASIFLVPVGGMALLQVIMTAASGGLTLGWVLTWEVRNGGHFYTYILMLVVFLAAAYALRDLFHAAMVGGLFVSLHELVWYSIVFSQNPGGLLGLNWLTSDQAMFLWMLTILIVYLVKKYPRTLLLAWGTIAYAGYQMIRASSLGITKTPTIEFVSWIIMALFMLGHLWIVGRKRLKEGDDKVEGYELFKGTV